MDIYCGVLISFLPNLSVTESDCPDTGHSVMQNDFVLPFLFDLSHYHTGFKRRPNIPGKCFFLIFGGQVIKFEDVVDIIKVARNNFQVLIIERLVAIP